MKDETKTGNTTPGRHPRPFAPIRAYSRLFAVRKLEPFLPFRPRAFGFVPQNALNKYRHLPLDTAKYRLKKEKTTRSPTVIAAA